MNDGNYKMRKQSSDAEPTQQLMKISLSQEYFSHIDSTDNLDAHDNTDNGKL